MVSRPHDNHGTAAAFEHAAWMLLLVMTGLVPLLMTNVSFGSGAYRALTFDAVSLPKTVAIMLLGGLGLASHGIAVLLGGAQARYSRVMLAVWGLAAWVGVSAAFALSTDRALFGEWQRNSGLAAFIAYAVTFTLAVQVVTTGARLKTMARVLSGSAALVALYGLFQYAGADPFSWPSQAFGTRMFGTFGNPDLFAAFLVMPLAIAAGLALSEEGGTPRFWLASAEFAIIGAALVLSLVRGAWLGGAVAVAALAFAVWRTGSRLSRTHIAAIGACAIAAAGAVLVSVLSPQEGLTVVERLRSSFSAGEGGSIAERIATWRVAVQAGLDRPVLGHGPDSFITAFRLHADQAWWSVAGHARSANNAHDLPLQYWVTMGIPGLLLVLGSVGSALAGAVKAFDPSAGRSRLVFASVWAGMLGLFVTLLSGVTTPMVLVWLWLGAGTLVAARARTVELPRPAARIAIAAASSLLVIYAGWGATWILADGSMAAAAQQTSVEDAAEKINAAIRINPLPLEYRMQLGSLYEQSLWSAVGSAPDAVVLSLADSTVTAYEAAVEADSHDALANIQLLHALNARFELAPDEAVAQEALSVAGDVIETWPMMPDAENEVARAEMHVGALGDAEKHAREATELDPAFSYAWLTLGEVLADEGKPEEARDAMEKAVELDPQDTDAAQKLELLTTNGDGS